MRTEKRLLHDLMRFADGDPLGDCLTVGIHRDSYGTTPLLYVPTFPILEKSEGHERAVACMWLSMARRGLETMVANLTPRIRTELFLPIPKRRGPLGRPRTWHGQLTLRTDTTVESWAVAVLTLAVLTPTGEDDCLANRIAHCETCGRYFILPTSRPSRVCSPECRKISRRKVA